MDTDAKEAGLSVALQQETNCFVGNGQEYEI